MTAEEQDDDLGELGNWVIASDDDSPIACFHFSERVPVERGLVALVFNFRTEVIASTETGLCDLIEDAAAGLACPLDGKIYECEQDGSGADDRIELEARLKAIEATIASVRARYASGAP